METALDTVHRLAKEIDAKIRAKRAEIIPGSVWHGQHAAHIRGMEEALEVLKEEIGGACHAGCGG